MNESYFRPALRLIEATWLLTIYFLLLLPLIASAEKPNAIPAPDSIEPFFETYCYSCHDADTAEADLNLEDLTRKIADSADALNWQDILDQLNSGEMPPKKKKQPSSEELAAVVGDLTESLQAAQNLLKDSGGSIALRRLNQREYVTTIKQLMGIRLSPDKLPDDPDGRFDTIGQNQTLSAMYLEKYLTYGQEVARTALHWACEPRMESKVLERREFANTETRSKRIYEIMEKVRLVKEEGKTPAEAGLTDGEWPKYDPDHPNAQNGVWKGQRQYYERNLHIHAKGRMLSHDLLVESVSVFFRTDARAHYRVRFCGGVVDGVAVRRGVRMMEHNGKFGGKHGSAFGSFWIQGTLDDPSVHTIDYYPVFRPDFRPDHWHKSRKHLFALEDKRGGPGFEQFYHHYRPIEPEAPKDTIFAKWMEVEGPFYDPKSPFENLVEKYQVTTSTDEVLDSVAKQFLAEFAEVVFRYRGVPEEYIDKLSSYYVEQRKAGLGFREAIVAPLAMMLTSSSFLYLAKPGEEAVPNKALDAISLANRLSYFLWSSPPDEELQELAESGELLKPAVLEQQVDRMLESPLAEHFFEGFMSQWAHLDRFDSLSLDSKLLVHRTDGMIHASRREPVEFFKTLVRENLPASDLIDSDFVMANGVLAGKYGLADLYTGDGFKKIQLPPDSPRGGLITQAAFLSAGTMGNRTSPVIRGSLVKEVLLNDPPPPPPPNVPELDSGADHLASVRSLVELHQTKAQCASCHARFDFIGLGLENFDAVGLWRDEELVTEAQQAQQIPHRPKKMYPVDASGSLPNGETFEDVHGLKAALMKEERAVAGSIFEGLLCYALGRDVSFTDRPLLEESLNEMEADAYPLGDMIKLVVKSKPFLNR
ncbi:MAG: DUF1592 domain-containing protein [Verrucomicrobiota bacterium]